MIFLMIFIQQHKRQFEKFILYLVNITIFITARNLFTIIINFFSFKKYIFFNLFSKKSTIFIHFLMILFS